MASKNPASDVVAFLTGKTLGGVALTSGGNLFIGPMRTDLTVSASPAVFVLNTGGVSPAPYLNGNRESYFEADVLIQVRGAPDEFQAAEALARGIFDELHLASLSGYVQVLAQDGHPPYIGTDESNRHIWSMDFVTEYKA